MRVTRLDPSYKQELRRYLSADSISNAAMIYDLDHQSSSVEFWLAMNDSIEGVLLIRRGDVFTSVWLQGSPIAARQLCKSISLNRAVFLAPMSLGEVVEACFPISARYVEDLQVVNVDEAKPRICHEVRRLAHGDAAELARLSSERFRGAQKVATLEQIEKHARTSIDSNYVVGSFDGDRLVSTAASYFQLPLLWMLGGVFTDPEYRCRGLATSVTSAVLREAAISARLAILLVRTDNHAKRLYERLGFRTISQQLWLDLRTGVAP